MKKYDPLYFSFLGGGHTSSTLLNSCSFQRYRLSFRNLYSILLTQALPVLDVLPHDTHPPPVVDDDKDDGDPGHEDDRQADGGRVLVSLRVKV